MHKLVVLSACVFLGGCATTGAPSQQQISETAKVIQAYTRTICSFVPTVNTLVNIVSSGKYQSAQAMANDICAAVTTAPLSQGGTRKAYVGEVRVRGEFTNGRKI